MPGSGEYAAGVVFWRMGQAQRLFRAIRNSKLVAIVSVKYARFAWNIYGSCLKSWHMYKGTLFIFKTVLVWKLSLVASLSIEDINQAEHECLPTWQSSAGFF